MLNGFCRELFQVLCVIVVTGMVFVLDGQSFQDETTSKVFLIMMFSLPMSGCRRSDSKWFAITANLFAAQPLRPQFESHPDCLGSGSQTSSDLNLGNTDLRSEEASYPLRS